MELCRKYANRFNSLYGDTFRIPEMSIVEDTKIMSLSNGLEKMSKSDNRDKTRINLVDT